VALSEDKFYGRVFSLSISEPVLCLEALFHGNLDTISGNCYLSDLNDVLQPESTGSFLQARLFLVSERDEFRKLSSNILIILLPGTETVT